MRSYGLIGYPLGHSFSKRFFTEKFLRENRAEQYLNFELKTLDELPEIIKRYPDLCGLNVTIPYKVKVIGFMDFLDREALETNAVNTIRINRTGEKVLLEGFNSDISGFTRSFAPLLKPRHTAALVLGTGGAAKAVLYSLKKLGIDWVQVSRNPSGENCISYSEISKEVMKGCKIIINATPVGTYPETATCPDIPYGHITSEHLLYDLVYNPPESLFLARGRQMGAEVKNGLEMLELQALKSYEIWNPAG